MRERAEQCGHESAQCCRKHCTAIPAQSALGQWSNSSYFLPSNRNVEILNECIVFPLIKVIILSKCTSQSGCRNNWNFCSTRRNFCEFLYERDTLNQTSFDCHLSYITCLDCMQSLISDSCPISLPWLWDKNDFLIYSFLCSNFILIFYWILYLNNALLTFQKSLQEKLEWDWVHEN